MATAGRVVTINSNSFRTPPGCCSCGAPQQTEIETKRSQKNGNVTTTLRMSFPYCLPCAARAKSYKTMLFVVPLIAVAFAVVIGGIIFAIPALPFAVGLVIALVVGSGGSIAVAVAMRPKVPAPPATARGEGARILSFASGNKATIYCTNPAWGDAFAQANGVMAQTKDKGDGFFMGPVLTAILLVPAAAAGAWLGAHPTIHVDNASAEPLQLYVDGKQVESVGANANTSFMVGYGKHTLGWSKAAATTPAGTLDAKISVSGAYLYNPGKTACYWLVADAYGAASTSGLQQGAQPIQELYEFKKVDTWFGDNPQSIKVEKGASGGTRVALQRSKSCMDFVTHKCSLESRQTLVACQRAATTEESFEACYPRAKAMCQGESGASANAADGANTAAPTGSAAKPPTTKPGTVPAGAKATAAAPGKPAPPPPAKPPAKRR